MYRDNKWVIPCITGRGAMCRGICLYTSFHHFQVQTNDCSPSIKSGEWTRIWTWCKKLVWTWRWWGSRTRTRTHSWDGAGAQHHNNKATGSTGVNWERLRRVSFTAASAANAHSQEFKGQSWPLYCTCPKERWEVKDGRWCWAAKGWRLQSPPPGGTQIVLSRFGISLSEGRKHVSV